MAWLRAFGLGLVACIAVVMASIQTPVVAQTTGNPTPFPTCDPNVVPIGQSNPPGSQLEPLAPIWCFNLTPAGAPTRISGANDWVDDFTNVTQMGRFDDGDYDYRVYPNVQNQPTFHSQHFTNNQHWMDDNAYGGNGGTMIRPNRSFKFENGTLVVEQDIAANISGYAGDAWTEITISNQPAPTGETWDNLYAYGQFGAPNSWTIGCRITNPICSVESPQLQTEVGSNANCNVAAPHRLMEIGYFEICGMTHFGGCCDPDYQRECSTPDQQPDMMCRDRFRMEITGSGLKYYINGHLHFEDSGWPLAKQIPPDVLAGDWYVYAADWQDTHPYPAYRFHWDRFAVNPHNPDGSIMAPSAAPNFCLGQPNNTCPMTSPTSTPTAVVATSTPTSTATAVVPTDTPVPPTATSVATATPTGCVPPRARRCR